MQFQHYTKVKVMQVIHIMQTKQTYIFNQAPVNSYTNIFISTDTNKCTHSKSTQLYLTSIGI